MRSKPLSETISPISLAGSWKLAFVLLALPAVELLWLGQGLAAGLALPKSLVRDPLWDLLIPLPPAFFLLIFALNKGRPAHPGVRKVAWAIHLSLLSLYLECHHLWLNGLPISGMAAAAVLATLFVATLASALCVWVSPAFYLENPNAAAWIPSVPLAGSVALYRLITPAFRERLGAVTSAAAAALFQGLFGNRVSTYVGPEGYLMVSHRSLLARIGPSCWGMDGFFFFTVLYLMALVFYRNRMRLRHWLFCLAAGFPFVFGLNVLRIALLFCVGIWLQKSFGTSARLRFFSVFHPYLGWIFYTVSLALYFKAFIGSEVLRRAGDCASKRKAGWPERTESSRYWRATSS